MEASVGGTVTSGFKFEGETGTAKMAFFGGAVTAQPSAYTQTYSTADKTHAARTAVSMGDLVATDSGVTNSWGASSEANFDKITTAVDQLIADQADTAQIVNSLIDDLQALGLAS